MTDRTFSFDPPDDDGQKTGTARQARQSLTLEQVARRAGVSTATVARVIHAKGYVSDETRQRVQTVVRETGYRPNAMARSLRQQRSYTFGHMLVELTANPFNAYVARSVETAAIASGYKSFVFSHNLNPVLERNGVERFIERRVDAMLLSNPVDAENVALIQAAGIPIVQIERECTGGTHSVLVDSSIGVREAMRHLIELGHRRIAFIGGDPELYPNTTRPQSIEEQRLGTYVEMLRGAGISVDPDLIRLGVYLQFDDQTRGLEGFFHTEALLGLRDRPTAIVAGCDVLSVGVLQALYGAQLRVPDDVSVVSVDDTLAMSLAPQLTVVAQPMEAIGREAVRLALAAVEDPDLEPTTTTLPTKLVIRQSTGAPRAPSSRRA